MYLKEISCLILAAGHSSRMGRAKALLPFSGEENFLGHLIRVYRQAGIHRILVVISPGLQIPDSLREEQTFEVCVNEEPERGRMHSIQLGLQALRDLPFCFIQNVDNPFVRPELVRQMAAYRRIADYVAPVHHGQGGHPVLISAPVIQSILEHPDDAATLRDLLSGFRAYHLETQDEGILRNINTQADYERYFLTAADPGA